jgi:effector-binding domain-containing protein
MRNAKPDTNSEVDDLIRRNTQVDVPIQVEERLRRRLAEFQTKIEQRPPSSLRTLMYSLMRPPAIRVPAVAALVAAAVVALVILPVGSNTGRAYAQAVAQLRAARSLQYTLVLAPYTEVEFSYLAPRSRRVNCSWGIEIRTDNAGRQIVLLHWTRQYAMEKATPTDTLANDMDLVDQLRGLPQTADETLGEQQAGDKPLTGYRLRHMPPNATIGNLKHMDLWVDGKTGQPDHVDITIQEAGKPFYTMRLKDIRLDSVVDPSQFDTTPPAGYSAISAPGGEKHGAAAAERPFALRPEIKQAEALTAVVVRMKGSFLQTRAVVEAVEAHLKEMGVTPAGPAFGRFGSEQDWDAGYPVPSGTRVKMPFQTVTVAAATVASAIVPGAWGRDSESRWAVFLKWVVEHGYVPTGPPMELWSGDELKPQTQSTEMRLAVRRAN